MDPEAPGLLSSIIGSAHKETRNLSRSISKMFRNFLFSVQFMVYGRVHRILARGGARGLLPPPHVYAPDGIQIQIEINNAIPI